MFGKKDAPTRTNSVVSLQSTRTGDTQPSQLPTNRTATTTRSASGSGTKNMGMSNLNLSKSNSSRLVKSSKDTMNTMMSVVEDRDQVQEFDLGTFFNLAEWYGDDPYMALAMALFEQAPGHCPTLRSHEMTKVVSHKVQQDVCTKEVDEETMDERDKLVSNNVTFNLPSVNENGNLTWDKVSYRLPIERSKQARDLRNSLLKFLDSANTGKMLIDDLKIGFARIVMMPGVDDPDHMLDEVIRHSQRAVQDLMLDGAPRHNDDIITKEFRVFLMFLQGYMDLWEIFFEVDESGDEMVMLSEFCMCAPKLQAWGMKDPALAKQPAMVFAQIDKDESGYVTFGEFADFCIRKGLMEEVAKDLQKL